MRPLLMLISFFALPAAIQAQADEILGVWLTEEKDGKVKVYKKDGKYFGKLIWGANVYDEDGKPLKDENNPDETLRNRTLINMNVLSDFSYMEKSGTWEGTVYDSRSGKSYKSFLEMKGDCLILTGYIIIKAFSKSTTWSRVE